MTTSLPPWLQIAWAVTAILIALGAVGWALLALWPYMRVTRAAMMESLELGRASSGVLKGLESEVKPLVADLRGIVGDFKILIGDIKEQRPGRILEFLEKLEKDGSIQKITQSVEAIARQAHAALEKSHAGSPISIPLLEPPYPPVPLPFCKKCGLQHHPIIACTLEPGTVVTP